MANIKKMCYVMQEQSQEMWGIYKGLLMVCFILNLFLDRCLLSDFYVDCAGLEHTEICPSLPPECLA